MHINLIELFEPYLLFISFFITLIINTLLIIKSKNWYLIIFANVILSVSMNMIGLGSFDFLTQVITQIIDILIDIIAHIFKGVGSLLKTLIDAINPF